MRRPAHRPTKKAPAHWFRLKRYGYGCVPATWQGWLLLAVYVAVVAGGAPVLFRHAETSLTRALVSYYVFVAVAAGVFLWIVRRKSPKWRWRWGREPDDDRADGA